MGATRARKEKNEKNEWVSNVGKQTLRKFNYVGYLLTNVDKITIARAFVGKLWGVGQ